MGRAQRPLSLLLASRPSQCRHRRRRQLLLRVPFFSSSTTTTTTSRRGSSSTATTTVATATTASSLQEILRDLRNLDTACLCDADKSLVLSGSSSSSSSKAAASSSFNSYVPLVLLDSTKIRPVNRPPATMAGIVRTVQCTERNDFLAVLRGLSESRRDEVLVVNTLNSTRAVAGELFFAEARRKRLAGIVVADGPVRDTSAVRKITSTESDDDDARHVRCYASAITPYSGTTQSCGTVQVPVDVPITANNIEEGGGTTTEAKAKVSPGDIMVGDDDGLVVGSFETFRRVVPVAQTIQRTEETILRAVLDDENGGTELTSLTNYAEHLQKRLRGEEESALEFKV